MSARAGSEQLRRGSNTANRPGLGLPAAVQNEQTVYDIIYDIHVYDINHKVYDIIYDIHVYDINHNQCRYCFDPISMAHTFET